MQATDVVKPDTMETVLTVLSYATIGFAALWLVTTVLGYMHRRSYNLTRAESGGGKPITPDFLKVDQKKRQAAIDRGAAYDKVLEEREAARAAPASAASVSKADFWARAAATVTAFFSLAGAVVGTLTKVENLEAGAAQLSNWETFVDIVTQHPVGTTIAIVVIGANILIFFKATKKTPAKA
jgi:hypothetical protein